MTYAHRQATESKPLDSRGRENDGKGIHHGGKALFLPDPLLSPSPLEGEGRGEGEEMPARNPLPHASGIMPVQPGSQILPFAQNDRGGGEWRRRAEMTDHRPLSIRPWIRARAGQWWRHEMPPYDRWIPTCVRMTYAHRQATESKPLDSRGRENDGKGIHHGGKALSRLAPPSSSLSLLAGEGRGEGKKCPHATLCPHAFRHHARATGKPDSSLRSSRQALRSE